MNTKKTNPTPKKPRPKKPLGCPGPKPPPPAKAKLAPGRPSKLTPKQWDEIRRRLAAGESTSALAREFHVAKATISGRCSQKVERIKTLANRRIAVDQEFENLPISEQSAVINLVDALKATSQNLTRAARDGSATSARLTKIANRKAGQLDPESVDMEDLREIAALTQIANQASTLGTALVASSRNNPPAEEPAPVEERDLSHLSFEELRLAEYISTRIEGAPLQSTDRLKPGYLEPGLIREAEKCLASIKENSKNLRQWMHPSAEAWDADWRPDGYQGG